MREQRPRCFRVRPVSGRLRRKLVDPFLERPHRVGVARECQHRGGTLRRRYAVGHGRVEGLELGVEGHVERVVGERGVLLLDGVDGNERFRDGGEVEVQVDVVRIRNNRLTEKADSLDFTAEDEEGKR